MEFTKHASRLAVLALLFTLVFSAVPAHALTNLNVYQSNDIVNSKGVYSVFFTLGVTHSITSIKLIFPAGFDVSTAYVIASVGLAQGILTYTAPETLTYTYLSIQNSLPVGRVIGFTLGGITAPNVSPRSNYNDPTLRVEVQTYKALSLIEDGLTNTFAIRQITGNDIATSSNLLISSLYLNCAYGLAYGSDCLYVNGNEEVTGTASVYGLRVWDSSYFNTGFGNNYFNVGGSGTNFLDYGYAGTNYIGYTSGTTNWFDTTNNFNSRYSGNDFFNSAGGYTRFYRILYANGYADTGNPSIATISGDLLLYRAATEATSLTITATRVVLGSSVSTLSSDSGTNLVLQRASTAGQDLTLSSAALTLGNSITSITGGTSSALTVQSGAGQTLTLNSAAANLQLQVATVNVLTSSATTITSGAGITSVIPTTTLATDLGSVSKYWNNLYVGTINAGSLALTGDITSSNNPFTITASTSGAPMNLVTTGAGSIVLKPNGVTELTVAAGGPVTVAAGGLTVTAGGLTVTAGGVTITAGNVVLGGVGTQNIGSAGNYLGTLFTNLVTFEGASAGLGGTYNIGGVPTLTVALAATGTPNIATAPSRIGTLYATNLDISGSVIFGAITSPSITAPAGSDLTLSAGTVNQNVNINPTGTGVVNIGGSHTVSSSASDLILQRATVTELSLVAGGVSVTGTLGVSGLLTASAGITVPTAQAVTLSGTATLSVGGTSTFTGLLTANGGITVAAGQTLTVSGATVTGTGWGVSTVGAITGISLNVGVTGANSVTSGTLAVGSTGQFAVDNTGAITGVTSIAITGAGVFTCTLCVTTGDLNTGAVSFAKLAGAAIPSQDNSVATATSTTAAFDPGRASTAVVIVTVDVTDTSAAANKITNTLTIFTSFGGAPAITPASCASSVVASTEGTITCVFYVSGIPGGSAGQFRNTITGVGAFTTNSNSVVVVWLPA